VFNRKGSSVLKKGGDGYTNLSRFVILFWALSIPHPNFFSSATVSIRLVSHTVICLLSYHNVRSLSLGSRNPSRITYLFSVTSRILGLSLRLYGCQSLVSALVRFSFILQSFHSVWLVARKFWFKFWKSEGWKHYAITNFSFFCIGLCFKGGRGVRA